MNLDLQKVLPAEAFETEQNEGDYIGKDGKRPPVTKTW